MKYFYKLNSLCGTNHHSFFYLYNTVHFILSVSYATTCRTIRIIAVLANFILKYHVQYYNIHKLISYLGYIELWTFTICPIAAKNHSTSKRTILRSVCIFNIVTLLFIYIINDSDSEIY